MTSSSFSPHGVYAPDDREQAPRATALAAGQAVLLPHCLQEHGLPLRGKAVAQKPVTQA
jgi:hypothetical protein